MATQLIKHGTYAGYREELATDSVCTRCRNAARVYESQRTKRAKAAGIHYGRHDVIDHLYDPAKARRNSAANPTRHSNADRERDPQRASAAPSGTLRSDPPPYRPAAESPSEPATEPASPSLADRLSEGLGRIAGQFSGNDYVEANDPPDYIHESTPDAQPDNDGWTEIREEDIVITKAGMEQIHDQLGLYLSAVGMAFEMVDPYCGPILAENLDNIVSRWTKVVARYPRAAKMFLSKDGGILVLWGLALQSLFPVMQAIYQHHLAKTIQTVNGRVYRVSPNGDRPTVDATMPPMAEYEYSVQP